MNPRSVPYINFHPRLESILPQLNRAASGVLEKGMYILGGEVAAFEEEIASYCGTRFAVGVSNGTSALVIALKALSIGPGDEVITVSNSFIATALAISLVGAEPVYVEPREDLNMDPGELEKAIGPKTKAIMPVHLTGRPAAMEEILAVAQRHRLSVVEDAAQSIGASLHGKRVGGLGQIAGFSLHPLKNLHAFGDAGFISTNDKSLYEKCKILRNLGLEDRDNCISIAGNDRLDELQAALLRVSLKKLDDWTDERRRLALRYNEKLEDFVNVPAEGPGEHCVFQTYVVLCERRDALLQHLTGMGVDAKIHYKTPIHLQKVYRSLGGRQAREGALPRTETLAGRIMSLPLYPGLKEEDQDHVINGIAEFYGS